MELPAVAQTPDGRRIEIGRTVDAPATVAWTLLVETRRWPDWGPSVTAVDCDADRIREGMTGRVRLPGGLWVPFEIDMLAEPTADTPGRWTWRIAKIPATGHRVEPLSEQRSRVVFELPPVAAGYAVLCHRALDRIERLLD